MRTACAPYDALRFTEVIVKLVPLPRYRATAMVGFATLEEAGSAVARSLAAGHFPSAIEILDRGSMELVRDKLPPGFEPHLEAVLIVEQDGKLTATLERGVATGTILAEAANFARDLANEPSNFMTPTELAARARAAADETDLRCEVLDAEQMVELGMGALLGVAKGSAQPPAFIVLHYRGDPSSEHGVGLIGKGITFDTGGISLKPPDRMEEMKYDMSGGAAVIATMCALGKLKPKLNVVGLVPATENMPGGKATKPGDIVKAMNGKTIEVINTDAEGRLILADALCYANKLGATKIIDAATLTGACVIALGHAASAAVSNDEEFVQAFLAAAKPSGERYWHMPLYDEYASAMKSDIADLKNTGGRAAGGAGVLPPRARPVAGADGPLGDVRHGRDRDGQRVGAHPEQFEGGGAQRADLAGVTHEVAGRPTDHHGPRFGQRLETLRRVHP